MTAFQAASTRCSGRAISKRSTKTVVVASAGSRPATFRRLTTRGSHCCRWKVAASAVAWRRSIFDGGASSVGSNGQPLGFGDLGSARRRLDYGAIEASARRLMAQGGEGDVIDDFTAEVSALGLDGLLALSALTAGSVLELAELEGQRPGTIVAQMSRVTPWRDEVGVVVHAILSAWVSMNPRQAVAWLEKEGSAGRSGHVVRSMAERLTFCVGSAALLSGMSIPARADQFADRFFAAPDQNDPQPAASQRQSGDPPGGPWRGAILPGGESEPEHPLPPGEVFLFPASRPPGKGTAHASSVPAPWGVIARSVDYTHTDPVIPMSSTIGWELPFTPHGVPALTKDMAERLQLELFAHDYWEGRGSIPMIMVSQGERPDFRVRTVSGESGLDVTRLTSSARRGAYGLHSRLRESVRRAPTGYRHLRGYLITVWYSANEIPGSELPPPHSDVRTRDLVLEHLQRLDPNDLGGHTQQVPGLPGGGTNVFRLGDWRPDSSFYQETGFELALAYSTEHTEADVWEEVSRLATNHDHDGVDRLLISVGVPTAPYGESFPADYLLWSLMPEAAEWPNPPALEHIRTVDVHDWWLGSVTRIHPQNEVLAPPRRSGPVVPVQSEDGTRLGWQVSPFRSRGL